MGEREKEWGKRVEPAGVTAGRGRSRKAALTGSLEDTGGGIRPHNHVEDSNGRGSVRKRSDGEEEAKKVRRSGWQRFNLVRGENPPASCHGDNRGGLPYPHWHHSAPLPPYSGRIHSDNIPVVHLLTLQLVLI